MMNEVIYDDHHLRCILQNGSRSDVLIVTFSEMGMRPLPNNSIWAGIPIGNLGFPAIGFIAKTPNWFPQESVDNAVSLIQDTLHSHGQRIGYGFSMGGWAILYYAKKLSLDTTISFSPQFSINPDEILDRRFSIYYKTHLNSGMSINKCSGGNMNIVVCDPEDVGDWESATKIANEVVVETVELKHVGHASVRCVSSTKALSDILNSAAASDKEGVVRSIKSCRRNSTQRPMVIAHKISSKKPSTAISIFKKT